MKKCFLCVLSVIFSFYAEAQNYTEEMKRLISYAEELRRSDDSDEDVYAKLVTDGCWTLMNEVEFTEGECSRSVRRSMPHFGINDLAYKAESAVHGKYISAGNFCNGTDSRYSYSFIEKTILAGKTVEYGIPGRTGKQMFVIVPFTVPSELKVTLSVGGGTPVSGYYDGSGNIVIEADAGTSGKDPLILSVTNGPDSDDSAYVIINYNSRSLTE